MQRNELRMTVLASLFTVLIIVGGYVTFPIGPVPIVLSDFFMLLTGLLLGAGWGSAAVGLYLLLGFLGFPVFAGGAAGLGILFGPTGGFLIGFMICVWVEGWIAAGTKPAFWKDLLAAVTGTVVLYGCGVPWLKIILKLSWPKALALGLAPFVLGAVLKVIVALAVVPAVRPLLRSFRNGA